MSCTPFSHPGSIASRRRSSSVAPFITTASTNFEIDPCLASLLCVEASVRRNRLKETQLGFPSPGQEDPVRCVYLSARNTLIESQRERGEPFRTAEGGGAIIGAVPSPYILSISRSCLCSWWSKIGSCTVPVPTHGASRFSRTIHAAGVLDGIEP